MTTTGHQAVLAIQTAVGATLDGLYGAKTAAAVAVFQKGIGLKADGVVGPATAGALFTPLIDGPASVQVAEVCRGIVGLESGFDPRAVGASTPQDLGPCQSKGPAWPQLDEAYRLDPQRSFRVLIAEITARFYSFGGRESDVIASWNLSIAGARAWADAGRPHQWKNPDPWFYISNVLELA